MASYKPNKPIAEMDLVYFGSRIDQMDSMSTSHSSGIITAIDGPDYKLHVVCRSFAADP